MKYWEIFFNDYIMVRMFTYDPGIMGLIPGGIIPKTLKIIIDSSLRNTHNYEVLVKSKWSNSEKGVARRCHSY